MCVSVATSHCDRPDRPACHPTPQEWPDTEALNRAACVSCTNIAPSSRTISSETSGGNANNVLNNASPFGLSVVRKAKRDL